MMIKKYISYAIFTVIILVTSGCASKQQLTNSIVEEKMNLLMIEDCAITKLGELPEITYTDEKIEVSENEIEENIQLILESYEKLKPANHEVVKKGDFVNLAYTVYCGGKVVNSSKGEELKVGAGYFNVEIEEKLIGAKKNKTYTIDIQVPKDDENKDVNGKYFSINFGNYFSIITGILFSILFIPHGLLRGSAVY